MYTVSCELQSVWKHGKCSLTGHGRDVDSNEKLCEHYGKIMECRKQSMGGKNKKNF